MIKVMITSTPIRKRATYRASTETAKMIISQPIMQGTAVKIRMVFRPTTLVKYAKGIAPTTQPTPSAATIQELSSGVMGMGESAANSLGMVGAAHPTPRPARVKDTEAGREKQRSITFMGKFNDTNTKKERREVRERITG
jgi:hypothetical protein